MRKLSLWLKSNALIIIITLVALMIKIAVSKEVGFSYSLNSDDLSYIKTKAMHK